MCVYIYLYVCVRKRNRERARASEQESKTEKVPSRESVCMCVCVCMCLGRGRWVHGWVVESVSITKQVRVRVCMQHHTQTHWQAAEDRADASKRMIPLPSPTLQEQVQNVQGLALMTVRHSLNSSPDLPPKHTHTQARTQQVLWRGLV